MAGCDAVFFVSRKPGWIVVIWLAIAAVVGCFSPNLTKLAAEGQAKMLASDAESLRAATLVKQSWPDQAYDSMAVAVLHRPSGLTDADRQFARRLAKRFEAAGRPKEMVRVLGPASPPEIAQRLVSPDGTVSLVAGHALDVVRRAGVARRGRLDGAPGAGRPSWRCPPGSMSAGRATR